MPITILVDYGDSFHYTNSNLIMKCHLESSKLPQSRMVQLAIGMKMNYYFYGERL